jgi:hypothetical protein
LEGSLDDFLFGNNLDPYNRHFSDWTTVWWKWLHSIPKEKSPATDRTGSLSGTFQNNPHVWFLAGTLGNSALRNCTIPYGKAVLFPIITSVFSFALDPHLKTEEDLTNAVREDIDTVEKLALRINEVKITNFSRLRVLSQPFDDVIDDMRTISVSDGYWAFLKPLKAGSYTIYFEGKNIDFYNEVTYHISIISHN